MSGTINMSPPHIIRQAIILAGGQGMRLRPITTQTPKPMIPFWGKPFLEYLIELLKDNGIEEVILLVGYLHEQIEEYFGNGEKLGISITYSYGPPESDTGTRIRNAYPLLDQVFLLCYGDNYWPLRLSELAEYYKFMGKKALVTVYQNRDQATKNNIFLEEGLVKTYDRTRKKKHLNGVDIGFFILDKHALDPMPTGDFSFEEVIVPRLIAQHELAGFVTEHKYYGLSNPERIPAIQEYFRIKKTVFLDRDGVINRRPPKAEYISRWSEFVFLPRVKDALALLRKKGYDIYVITNQAGIARKKTTSKQVDGIHRHFIEELKKLGVMIADIAVCPHGWDEDCFCRKPNPGLLFDLSYKYSINLYDSICIGDDPRDVQAGRAAGCKTILVGDHPDSDYDTLFDAVKTL